MYNTNPTSRCESQVYTPQLLFHEEKPSRQRPHRALENKNRVGRKKTQIYMYDEIRTNQIQTHPHSRIRGHECQKGMKATDTQQVGQYMVSEPLSSPLISLPVQRMMYKNPFPPFYVRLQKD